MSDTAYPSVNDLTLEEICKASNPRASPAT